MEDEGLVVGSAVSDADPDRIAAVGTLAGDGTVGAQRRPDAERIPAAIGIPPPPGRLDQVWGGDRRKRVRHVDRAGVVEDERVGVVQSTPPVPYLGNGALDSVGDVGGSRRLTELDEATVRRVPQLDIGRVRPGSIGGKRPLRWPA
jgi:hypothetical protein